MADVNGQVFFRVRQSLDFFIDEFETEFLKRVEDRTPVDTGHLQNSWAIASDADSIVINNDAEYASYVEHGTSRMAGAHMLAVTLSERENISQLAVRRAKSRAGVK